jgi:hypothetical protein
VPIHRKNQYCIRIVFVADDVVVVFLALVVDVDAFVQDVVASLFF